ncbi:hypothetical protein FisN_13Hh152 [Fistulifera solaris]|uniref:F-box domain-containing protein n=1 Tax=Fistulifera solaris TaxID=1519565 RepID=A0A1Z5KP87_FISSO|nr:hypothetical protein FisN_13Hh152 [Fistulifera solaris]|eukprot:GAX27748.1 hypothetical protein FisN_13Hh152 [Fistulifera solaris]
MTLLDLPDDLFSESIFTYVPVTDLGRFGTVCRKFHSMRHLVDQELKARDTALIVSQQYPAESPILSILDYRERVLWFERCSAFALEMTHQAVEHEACPSHEDETGCQCVPLNSFPRLKDGLRDGKNYFFFVQFTSMSELLWEGFLQDAQTESDEYSPLISLFFNENVDIYQAFDGEEINNGRSIFASVNEMFQWRDFTRGRETQFHLDASNITNLTKEHVNSDLHVTVVSLVVDQHTTPPRKLHLHYSSRGHLQSPSFEDRSVSFDVLRHRYLPNYCATVRETDKTYTLSEYATPYMIWTSRSCLFSFSLLHTFDLRSLRPVTMDVASLRLGQIHLERE